MEFDELKNKSTEELAQLLKSQAALLRELRFKSANQQLKTHGKFNEAKKSIAQIRALLTDRKNGRKTSEPSAQAVTVNQEQTDNQEKK